MDASCKETLRAGRRNCNEKKRDDGQHLNDSKSCVQSRRAPTAIVEYAVGFGRNRDPEKKEPKVA